MIRVPDIGTLTLHNSENISNLYCQTNAQVTLNHNLLHYIFSSKFHQIFPKFEKLSTRLLFNQSSISDNK